jgi:transglutaminase-like putative cysteine protease
MDTMRKGAASAQFSLLCILLQAISPTPGESQEPTPSIFPDSVHLLAVDSAAYPEESFVVLLDEAHYRIGSDGTWVSTRRGVRQVLKSDAVRAISEIQLAYNADREAFRLHWVRVLERDGTLVTDEPLLVQELDEPVPSQSPIYTDRKRVRISLGSVAPGRIVDLKYSLDRHAPPLPGDVWIRWSSHGPTSYRRSGVRVDAPESLALTVQEWNLPHPAQVLTEGGRTIRDWSAADMDRLTPEPFAAEENDVAGGIAVGGALTWEDIARWYDSLAPQRYELTPELEGKLRDLTTGAATLLDSLRAVHRWVAQDVRYVSISLGLGSYRPRSPGEVLASSSGDCKDKTTLLVALLRPMGVEAYPVLARTSGGKVYTQVPSIAQFNHMVAAVRTGPDGAWTFVDPTVPIAPWGEVYSALQGRTGVLLRDDGTAEVLAFPAAPAEENRSLIRVEGIVEADGRFRGDYTEETSGALQYNLRSQFASDLTQAQRETVQRSIAGRVFDGAMADSLEVFHGRDLQAVPRLRARVLAENVLREVGGGMMLRLRIPRYGSPEVIGRLESLTDRRFPIDAEQVFGRREHLTEYLLTLPEGWRAELPPAVLASSPFGVYESTYEQEGRTLVVRRRVRGTSGILPPGLQGELLEWFRAMRADDVEFVMLQPGG